MINEINIVKASGKSEPFSEDKLRSSLERSGASAEVIDSIIFRMRRKLKEGMTTAKIYTHAFKMLKKGRKDVAVRYSLRQAVMELGPTGFPFEKFIGEIFRTKGYEIKVGVTMEGFCVDHEIDVLMKKEHKHIMIEAKFHNQLGIKSDLKTALYVRARFEDLRKKCEMKETEHEIHEGWLVTNTKLTSKAIRYSICKGQNVISWNYPKNGNLQDLILESKVHPISCLTILSQRNKKMLFDKGVILCRHLTKNKKILKEIGLSDKKAKEVFDEMMLLCNGGVPID
jgi:hypothetical protein